VGLSLAASLTEFWVDRGYAGEGRRWLDGLLGAAGTTPSPATARGLATASELAYVQGDNYEALSLGARAVAMARQTADKGVLGWALSYLGWSEVEAGLLQEARRELEEALSLGRETGEQRLVEDTLLSMARLEYVAGAREVGRGYAEECIASCKASGNFPVMTNVLSFLARYEKDAGNYPRAIALFQEALEGARQMGDLDAVGVRLYFIGRCLMEQGDLQAARPYLEEGLASARSLEASFVLQLIFLAELYMAEGDYTHAGRLLEEALPQARAQGHRQAETLAMLGLGNVASAQGRPAAALELHRDALGLACQTGRLSYTVSCVEAVATTLAAHGEAEDAVVLLAAADRGRLESCMPLPPYLKPAYEGQIHALRAGLASEAFSSAWAKGRAFSISEASARGLEVAGSLLARAENSRHDLDHQPR
jgi:tetratricopeptide (TPR) repeat protein